MLRLWTDFDVFNIAFFALRLVYNMIYRRIDTIIKVTKMKFLKSHWKLDAIVVKNYCHKRIVKRWKKNIMKYENSNISTISHVERSFRTHIVVRKSFVEYLRQHSYVYQNELMKFLKKKMKYYRHSKHRQSFIKNEENITQKIRNYKKNTKSTIACNLTNINAWFSNLWIDVHKRVNIQTTIMLTIYDLQRYWTFCSI